jgi:hypothetical protein
MAKVTISTTVAIAGGASITATSPVFNAEATGDVSVELLADDATVTAEIQPSDASQLYVLLISSSYYGPELSYVFSDGTTDSAATFTLDGPQLFSAGNLSAIGVTPTHIRFTMTAAGAAGTVKVFVARDATP